jgi:hypothetical protein
VLIQKKKKKRKRKEEKGRKREETWRIGATEIEKYDRIITRIESVYGFIGAKGSNNALSKPEIVPFQIAMQNIAAV